MIPEGGFCGSAPGAATVCGDAYIALSVRTLPVPVRLLRFARIHATLSLPNSMQI